MVHEEGGLGIEDGVEGCGSRIIGEVSYLCDFVLDVEECKVDLFISTKVFNAGKVIVTA